MPECGEGCLISNARCDSGVCVCINGFVESLTPGTRVKQCVPRTTPSPTPSNTHTHTFSYSSVFSLDKLLLFTVCNKEQILLNGYCFKRDSIFEQCYNGKDCVRFGRQGRRHCVNRQCQCEPGFIYAYLESLRNRIVCISTTNPTEIPTDTSLQYTF